MILGSKMGLFGFGKLEMFNEIKGKLGSFGNNDIFPGAECKLSRWYTHG
jgi:hypothetical protein